MFIHIMRGAFAASKPRRSGRIPATLLCAGLLAAGQGPTAVMAVSSQPAFTSIARLPDGSIQLGMSGMTDSVYQLQASSNWTGWTPLAILTSAASGFQFKDASNL